MPLYRATTALAGEAAARALRDALDELDPAPLASDIYDHDDGSGLWDTAGLFDGPPDVAGLALLARLHAAPDFTIVRVEERDWVAQVRAELVPVEAGRFVVYGSHDRDRVAPNRIGLEIEAAQAFGTGHHATTQGCLLALDRLAPEMAAHHAPSGVAILSGILARQAAGVAAVYRFWGYVPEEPVRIGDWVTLVLWRG